MDLTVHIPDDIATRLCASGGGLSRRAFEALALEEYKSGRIARAEFRRLLSFGTRYWTGLRTGLTSFETGTESFRFRRTMEKRQKKR